MTFIARCHTRLADGSHKIDDFCDEQEQPYEYIIGIVKASYEEEGYQVKCVMVEVK